MKIANVLNGWRSLEEKPVEGVDLLVVLQDDDDKTYVVQLERDGLDYARSYEGFTLVAWQYCPMWVSGMNKSNLLRGWKNPNEYPVFNARVLIALKNNEYNTDFISIVGTKGFDNALYYEEYTMLAWQYCPEWIEE